MGSYLSWPRDVAIRPFAFPAPPASYTRYLPHLRWADDTPYRLVDATDPSEHSERRPLILFSHGNGCDMGQCLALAHGLSRTTRSRVVVYDYPGYGVHRCTSASQQGCYDAIQSVYHKLMVKQKIASGRDVILVGQSLGSGPSTWLAHELHCREDAPKALILISAFTSAIAVMSRRAADAMAVSSSYMANYSMDIFPNDRHLEGLQCPIHLLHGADDTVVPMTHGFRLARANPHRTTLHRLPQTGHNDVWEKHLPMISDLVVDVGRD